MALPKKSVLPQPAFPWVDGEGRPTQAFAQYITSVDQLLAAIATGNAPTLTNAANDAAAAKLGVAVGNLYRNGSVLQVRVT